MGLSPVELGVIVIVVVLLFGVKRLPELGSGLGQGIANFKKSYRDGSTIDVTPQEKVEDSNKSANKVTTESAEKTTTS